MDSGLEINKLSVDASILEEEFNRVKNIKEFASETFRLDFRYEYRWIHGDNPLPSRPVDYCDDPLGIKDDIKNSGSTKFKKLRNELAKICHPDLRGDDLNDRGVEEFKDIQKAYEEGNYTKLIDIALYYNVDIKLSADDIELLKKSMEKQRLYIKQTMESIEWFWHFGDRSNIVRSEVWKHIDVDAQKFEPWLLKSGYSISMLESECQTRKSKEKFKDFNPWRNREKPRAKLLITQ